MPKAVCYTWKERFDTAMLPCVTVKQMQVLCNVSNGKANEIRTEILDEAKEKGIRFPNQQLPTDIVLAHIGLALSTIEKMMKYELKKDTL